MNNTLLIIESDRNQRLLHRMDLEDEKYRVLTAATQQQALKKGTSKHPRLVILDPGLPGLQTQKSLRRIAVMMPHTPVIIYSGYAELVGNIPERLTSACLLKSSDSTRLLYVISQILRVLDEAEKPGRDSLDSAKEPKEGDEPHHSSIDRLSSTTMERGPPV
jgi:DNA-binding NtrC family response regulator